jgi:DNA-binding transcriptional LysR family regulator
VLAPFAAWLKGELPEVTLEVVSSVQYLDLVRREADLALRNQKPDQRDLSVLGSIEFEATAFAARSYAAKLPRGARVTDVDWIAWAPPFDDVVPNPQMRRLIPGFKPVFASDDYLVQLRACEAGIGAMFLGRVRHRFQRETSLVELDLDMPPVPASMHLVCARSALSIPRIRAVAELLLAEIVKADPRRPRRREPTGGQRGSRS